jgi:hypothetical protein
VPVVDPSLSVDREQIVTRSSTGRNRLRDRQIVANEGHHVHGWAERDNNNIQAVRFAGKSLVGGADQLEPTRESGLALWFKDFSDNNFT